MWNRFTHNILTIDSHVCRLARMRPRVAQKTFGHKLNFPLTWFLWATEPVTYSCWLSQMRLIFKRLKLILSGSVKTTAAAVRICQNICPNLCDCCYQLSACQLLTVVNQHSSTIEICDLSIAWLCPFDTQLICLYMQSVHPTICLISNLSSFTLQDDESKVYLGHPLFFLWLTLE